MENKRILIHEDRELLTNKMDDLRKYASAFNEVKKAYEGLELGDLNNEIYKDLVTGPAGIANIRESFFSELDQTLKGAGLNKEGLRKVHIDQANVEFGKLERAIQELKSIHPDPNAHRRFEALKVENTSYIDGVFQVSAMDQEDILEDDCRVYLESESEIKLHAHLKNVRDSINDLGTFLQALASGYELKPNDAIYFDHFTGTSIVQNFFIEESNNDINPYSIKWISEMISRGKALETTVVNSK